MGLKNIIPKGKKGGIVTSTIFGVGGLIIAVIVILVIVSTINSANVIPYDSVKTFSITNESVTFPSNNAVQTLGAGSYPYATCGAITFAHNQTRLGASVPLGNFTRTGCLVTNATALNLWGNGTIYVSYTWLESTSVSRDSVTGLTNNFTSGINNVSSKIPTILLIVAVVFLFGALVLLVRNANLMGIGGGSGNGSL